METSSVLIARRRPRFAHAPAFAAAIILPLIAIAFAPRSASALTYNAELITTPPPHIQAIRATGNRLYKIGYLDVTLYDGWEGHAVDKTGVKDSTAALQKAIDDAFDYQLVAFFPAGTYLVSDTLFDVRKAIRARGFSCNVTGSNAGAYPVIKLARDAPGFGDPDNPKPILHFHCTGNNDTPFGTPSASIPPSIKYKNNGSLNFLSSIQNLVIDCNENAGAQGIRFHAAQVSGIHNVKVIATGAYAGFDCLPSRSSGGASNIEVVGGRYGLLLEDGAGSPIVNVTLTGQTVAAIKNSNFVPVSLIGFHITKPAGAGVETFKSYNSSGGSMTLYDGIIEVAPGATAIENAIGKNLYVRNVYVSGTDQLIHTPDQTITGPGAWHRIAEYGYTNQEEHGPLPPRDPRLDSFSILDGVVGKAGVQTIEHDAPPPPADLVTRHGVPHLPSFEDPGALVLTEETPAKGDSGTDNHAIIQAFLDAHPSATIIIPKGRFAVSHTLTLPAHVTVAGIDRNISRIMAHASWKPTSQTAVISTADDAEATTWLGPLTIAYPIGLENHDYFAELNWRAGRHSTVFAVTSRFGMTGGSSGDPTPAHARCIITGHGGGRWYFWGMDQPRATTNPGYRHLLISGVTEPLWMYGCNLEKGDCDTRAEITDSKNVRIFNIKVEVGHDVMWIVNSHNIGIFDSGALRKPPNPGEGFFEVRGTSNDVVLANICPQLRDDGEDCYTVRESGSFGEAKVPVTNLVSLFKRGDIDDSLMGTK